jgi:transcriptional regulator with XRE-family HTH domain
VHFRTALKSEFRRRTERNPRYSLRAFARDLGSDHATLSQILRGRRSLSPRMVRHLGPHLRLDPTVIADASAQQGAEAILRLAQSPGFCVQSRWIATQTGLPIDAVNVALQRLLRDGDLVMESSTCWKTTRTHYA